VYHSFILFQIITSVTRISIIQNTTADLFFCFFFIFVPTEKKSKEEDSGQGSGSKGQNIFYIYNK
jgi:hypothetical protein